MRCVSVCDSAAFLLAVVMSWREEKRIKERGWGGVVERKCACL